MKKIIAFCLALFSITTLVQAQFFNNDQQIIKNLGLKTIPHTIQEQSFNTKGTAKNYQILGPNTKARCFKLVFTPAGQLKEEIQLNPKNLEEIVNTYAFDLSINQKQNSLSQKEKEIPNSEAKLDEKGRCIERTFFNGEGKILSLSTYTYDAQNNLLKEEIYDSNNRLYIQHIYEYDAYGNYTQVQKKSADNGVNLLLKYQYEYDENGNWTSRIEIEKGFVYTLTKRTYTYF